MELFGNLHCTDTFFNQCKMHTLFIDVKNVEQETAKGLRFICSCYNFCVSYFNHNDKRDW